MKLFYLTIICIYITKICCGLDGLNFLALGDWGGLPYPPYHTVIEETTANQMSVTAENMDAKFVIALGDNFYWNGVKNEFDARFEETFSDVFNKSSLQIPWYVIAGNHDHHGNVSAQISYSAHSKIWKYSDFWYAKKWIIPGTNRTMKLILVDTILLCGNSGSDDDLTQPQGPSSKEVAEKQWSWLLEQLKYSKDDYLLVGGHFPVWSIAEHGPTQCLVDRLKPLLEEYNVTAYLCGHDHNLQHIKEDQSTVNYFVIGAANFIKDVQDHRDDVPEHSLKFYWADKDRYGGFASINANNDGMTLTLIDSLGKTLHSKTMKPRF